MPDRVLTPTLRTERLGVKGKGMRWTPAGLDKCLYLTDGGVHLVDTSVYYLDCGLFTKDKSDDGISQRGARQVNRAVTILR